MSRLKKGGAVVATLVALTGTGEGIRQTAYPDPATKGKPWTICFGHTGDVKPGDHKSLEECKALFVQDLEVYAQAVERTITRDMPDGVFIAFTDFTYNVGPGTFAKSSVARFYNAGDRQGACNALLAYNRARVAGVSVVFPGLTRRRERERAYCLHG